VVHKCQWQTSAELGALNPVRSISLQDLGEVDPHSPLGLEWDQIVRTNPASGFMQSAHWAKYKRQSGWTVHHLGLFDNDQLFGGAIFYAAQNAKGAGFLAAPDGPVLPWEDLERAESGLQMLVACTQSDARSLGSMAMRIAPRLSALPGEILRHFSRAPLNLTEPKTLYLDLSNGPEALLRGIKPKARYNIGLAERRGVSIREENSLSAARDFHTLMQTVAVRNGFAVEPLSVFVSLIETLCPEGVARVFFAEHEGNILAAMLMIKFGDRATYLYGGTSEIKRNLMGGYALHWAAIKSACESGAKIYDFWGFDPGVAPDHSYAGFSRFKSQFCGTSIELIGTWDFYFMDQLADVVIRAFKEVSVT